MEGEIFDEMIESLNLHAQEEELKKFRKMNILRALHNGYDYLKSNKINSYKIDTELLLSDSLNISKEKLILNLKKN